jgi:hypothetical protein
LQFSLQAASPENFGYTLVVLPEKVVIAKLVKKFFSFMEPESSLRVSKQSTTGSHPAPTKFHRYP